MKKIGFIGAYDKTDLILYVAKVLAEMNQKVLVIAFTKPRRDSRIDYIRHMVNDEPEIQTWLETYIANYREQLRRQAQ